MEQVTKIWNWSTDADGWTFNQGLISTDTYWSSGSWGVNELTWTGFDGGQLVTPLIREYGAYSAVGTWNSWGVPLGSTVASAILSFDIDFETLDCTDSSSCVEPIQSIPNASISDTDTSTTVWSSTQHNYPDRSAILNAFGNVTASGVTAVAVFPSVVLSPSDHHVKLGFSGHLTAIGDNTFAVPPNNTVVRLKDPRLTIFYTGAAVGDWFMNAKSNGDDLRNFPTYGSPVDITFSTDIFSIGSGHSGVLNWTLTQFGGTATGLPVSGSVNFSTPVGVTDPNNPSDPGIVNVSWEIPFNGSGFFFIKLDIVGSAPDYYYNGFTSEDGHSFYFQVLEPVPADLVGLESFDTTDDSTKQLDKWQTSDSYNQGFYSGTWSHVSGRSGSGFIASNQSDAYLLKEYYYRSQINWFIGCGIKPLSLYNTTLLSLECGDGIKSVDVKLNADGTLSVVNHAGTVLGTTTRSITTSWHYLELQCYVNLSFGKVKLHVDGESWLDLNNVNTDSEDYEYMYQVFFRSRGSSPSQGIAYDDIYIATDLDGSTPGPIASLPGPQEIGVLHPNGAGYIADWESVPSSPAWNSLKTQDDDTSYSRIANYSGSDKYLSFAMEDITASTDSPIIGVQHVVWGKGENQTAVETDHGISSLPVTLEPEVSAHAQLLQIRLNFAYGSRFPSTCYTPGSWPSPMLKGPNPDNDYPGVSQLGPQWYYRYIEVHGYATHTDPLYPRKVYLYPVENIDYGGFPSGPSTTPHIAEADVDGVDVPFTLIAYCGTYDYGTYFEAYPYVNVAPLAGGGFASITVTSVVTQFMTGPDDHVGNVTPYITTKAQSDLTPITFTVDGSEPVVWSVHGNGGGGTPGTIDSNTGIFTPNGGTGGFVVQATSTVHPSGYPVYTRAFVNINPSYGTRSTQNVLEVAFAPPGSGGTETGYFDTFPVVSSSGAAEGNSARVTQDVLETIYDPIIHSRLTQEVIETLYDPVVSARSTQEVVETSYDPVVSARVTQEVIEIVTSDIEAPNPLGWAAWNPMIRVLQTDTRQVHRFRGTGESDKFNRISKGGGTALQTGQLQSKYMTDTLSSSATSSITSIEGIIKDFQHYRFQIAWRVVSS